MGLQSNKQNENKKLDVKNLKINLKSKDSKNKYLEQKDMDFLERYETVVEGKEEKINPMFYVFPAAAVVGIILVAFVIINVMTAVLNNSNKKIQTYVDDSANISSYNEAVKLSTEISTRNSSKSAIENMIKIMEKYPSINEAFISSIYSSLPEGVTIQTVNYNSSQAFFTISCVASNVNTIPTFINNLETTDKFEFVGYTGYNGGTGGYSFTVNCICNGN